MSSAIRRKFDGWDSKLFAVYGSSEMTSCVVMVKWTSGPEQCHKDSETWSQQSGTECGLSYPANAGRVSLHDVCLYHNSVCSRQRGKQS